MSEPDGLSKILALNGYSIFSNALNAFSVWPERMSATVADGRYIVSAHNALNAHNAINAINAINALLFCGGVVDVGV